MAYYECLNNNDHINIGDKFTVTLSGSHNQLTTTSVCYVNKSMICLLGDVSLATANWSTQCTYAWNYSLNINGKEYNGTCRIPTLEQIYSKCAGYRRDFAYWLYTKRDSTYSWIVNSSGSVFVEGASLPASTLPFIEITL